MARSKQMSVQKRLREQKKSEAQAQKRLRNQMERPPSTGADAVAAREDLEGYGVIHPKPEDTPETP